VRLSRPGAPSCRQKTDANGEFDFFVPGEIDRLYSGENRVNVSGQSIDIDVFKISIPKPVVLKAGPKPEWSTNDDFVGASLKQGKSQLIMPN